VGLYDEIYCEVELPDRDVPADTWFQTKSLPWPGNFCRYRITVAGRLVTEATTKRPMDLSSIERAL